ncbi:MAG: Thymidylate kinase [Alectoria sarmentosa]|nr:MAG: Thymidylate kinase [Alectoria sarmentosa]
MPPRSRGILIVIEGLDRAGKSTQHARLCQSLERQGRRVKRMRFPDRTTTIGKSIDAYLKGESQQEDHAIHLLFSANRWEAAGQIRNAVEEGITVVIDRYYYSGIVYSAAKDKADLSLKWARDPEIGLPRPDVCVFLDIAPEAAAKRGGFGGEKYETSTIQKRVRELFYKIMGTNDGMDIRIVDAGRSVEEVEQDVMERVKDVMDQPKMAQPLTAILPWEEMAHTPGQIHGTST